MEAQHCKLLHCAKRKVQENKRQKPGVDLAARIFCPQGNQPEEKERKQESCDSFYCWQWQHPRSEGNTGWKEGSKSIRAISSHRITSFLEVVGFICITNCLYCTCPKIPSPQVAGKLKTQLIQCSKSVFNLGNQTYMPGLWLSWPGIKQVFSSSSRGSSAKQWFRPDDWKAISSQVPAGVYAA